MFYRYPTAEVSSTILYSILTRKNSLLTIILKKYFTVIHNTICVHSLRKGSINRMRAQGASEDDRRDRGNYAAGSKMMNQTYIYAVTTLDAAILGAIVSIFSIM
jgi:hypothetical protein